MSDSPTVEELDALPTEELRRRAFEQAEQRRDVGFFWDLVKHLRPSQEIAAEDASAGHITGSITDAVAAVRELTSGGFGDEEPLVRARFIDYLHRGE